MYKHIIAVETSMYMQCTNLLNIAVETSTYLQCTNLLLQSKHQRICNVQTYYCSQNINVSAMYKLIIAVKTSTYLQCTNLLLRSKHQRICNVQTYYCSRNINVSAMYKLIIAAETSTAADVRTPTLPTLLNFTMLDFLGSVKYTETSQTISKYLFGL